MDWIKLGIALIVIVGWVVSSFQEKAKERPDRPTPPPLPPPEGDQPPSRRTADNLQDFLEEVRRRKKATNEAFQELPRRQEEPLPAILVEEKPRRNVEEYRAPSRPKPPPLPPVTAPSVPTVVRYPEPPRLPSLSTSVPATTLTQKDIDNAINVPAFVSRRPAIPAVANTLALLRQPQSLATAFILREILDAPLCKRRHRKAR